MTLEEMKQAKKERGNTLAQLAECAKVPLGTLQKIFSGETEIPRYATRQAIEQALSDQKSAVKETMAYGTVPYEKQQGAYTLREYALHDDRTMVQPDVACHGMRFSKGKGLP